MRAASIQSETNRRQGDLAYRSVGWLGTIACRLMRWDVTVSGEQHIPGTGPAVIASNHVGYMDFVFLGLAARRRGRLVRFMAIQSAFDHWLAGPLLRSMHHIPVDRDGDPAAAYRLAVSTLEAGDVIGIHPEGKVTASPLERPAKSGAVRMALLTGAPLIPAAVWGTQRLLAPGSRPKLPRHVPITVRMGSPIDPDPSMTPVELTERLMEQIRGLLPEGARTARQTLARD
jgi:1-acyl-sn-glycerol-3-phosphate acyltransferase